MAGDTTDAATGGFLVLESGYSSETSSGFIDLSTPNAGSVGVSGEISVATGTTSAGNSGAIALETGYAHDGHGGTIMARVGTGHSDDGGNVFLAAGESTDDEATGGSVTIQAGEGSSTYASMMVGMVV